MKRRKKLLVICICFGLMLSLTVPSFANEIGNAKSEMTRLEKKKNEMKQKVANLQKEKGNIMSYIQKLDVEMDHILNEMDVLKVEIKEKEEELKDTKQDLKAAKEQESTQYETMKKRIKYTYENGSDDYIEVILNADSIADMLNRTEYIAKISEYDNNLFLDYQDTKQMVIDKEKKQKKQLKELNEASEELKLEQETLEELVADKKSELDKYNANIENTKDSVEAYDKQIEEQEALIEELLEAERRRIEEERRRKEEEERKRREEEAKNQGGSSSSGGDQYQNVTTNFRWPLPVSGTITSRFGYRNSPTAGASSYHKGIDIAAPTGTSIMAAAGGEVVVSGYQAAAGNYIMIYHGNSTYTVYMHCSRLLVQKGQMVKQGDKIALVGSTGVSTGPHLHFGVSVNGSYRNPLEYVSN